MVPCRQPNREEIEMKEHKNDRHGGLALASLLALMALLLGTGWAGAATGAPEQVVPVWGTDVRANSDSSGYGQHEPHLAISRTNPDVMVAVAKDYRRINTKEVWIYVSQDGGQTWPLEKQLQVPGLPPDVPNQSDPLTMARDDGRLYVLCLGYDTSGSGHGLFLTWSDDDGDTWRDAVSVTHNETPGSLDDKEWLAIDNSPASPHYHNMYIAWSDPYGLGILFSRSTDGGLTWSPYLDMIPGSSDFTEYAYPIVGADGTLYVFYMDGWGYCADGYIRFLKSTDGGATFTGPYTVVFTSQPCSPIHGSGGYDQWRFFSIIAAAADPTDPDNLWVAWTDDNGIPNGKTDVLYVRSTDGGATWSTAERLSHDDPAAYIDHITPVFAMGAEGRLHAFWLDRRDDPSNVLFHGYHTSTADGGDTWEPDSRVSDDPFDLNIGFPPGSNNAAGDYWGLDTVGNVVMAAWNTTVLGEQDIYVSRGILPGGATLTGEVSDALTSAPIEGALVSVYFGPTVVTDPSGVYSTTLMTGTYTVAAQASGYYSQTVSDVEVLSGTRVLDFVLTPLVCPEPTIEAVEVLTYGLTAEFSAEISSTLPISYLWSFGDGITSTQPTPIHTYSAYGTYPFTLAVTNACGTDIWSGQVILVPEACPPPTIESVAVHTHDLTAQFSAEVSFTLPISYLWSFGDGITSTLPAPTHTYAVSGTYPFTLTVTNACGEDVWSDEITLPTWRIYLPVVRRDAP
jgi:PKD repeat protein